MAKVTLTLGVCACGVTAALLLRHAPGARVAPESQAQQLAADRAVGQDEAAWSDTALLLIDVQNGFWDVNTRRANPGFADRVAKLLEVCRTEGIEVVHVRMAFAPDGSDTPPSFRVLFPSGVPCLHGEQSAQPLPGAAEQAGEEVFYKQYFDGFTSRGLEEHLAAGGKKHVLVAGLTTEMCVLSTAMGAINRGMLVTLVQDCCAAPDRKAHDFVIDRYRLFPFDVVDHAEIVARRPQWRAAVQMVREQEQKKRRQSAGQRA